MASKSNGNGRSPASVTSISALAIELGRNRRTVSDYSKDSTFPRNPDGSYPIGDCIRWTLARVNGHSADDGDLREEKLKAEIDKLRADARAKEIKNAVSLRDLLPADQVMHYLNECAVLVKTRLEELPDMIASEAPPKIKIAVREATARVVYRLLLELSEPAFVAAPEDEDVRC